MAWLDSKFYYPRRNVHIRPEDLGVAHEPVTFETDDGCRLHGLWFPAGGRAAGTVVHCHGNFGNVTYHFGHSFWLAREGFDVLCFDYRGYGRSSGRVTRDGTIRDAHAALDFAAGRAGSHSQKLLLFGQSLGGAVALVTAAQRRDLAGVAADGPFSDYRDEALWVCRRQWYTWAIAGPLVRLGFSRGQDPIDHVARIAPTPLYLFHGENDRICPSWMSRALYERALNPKKLWIAPGMDHDQALHELADQARPRLVRFFRDCVAAQAARPASAASVPGPAMGAPAAAAHDSP